MAKLKKKRDQISVDVGKLHAALEAARAADEEMTLSRLVRLAVRHWLHESPQAMNADELWVLQAIRAVKKRMPDKYVSVLRMIESYAKNAGVAMNEGMGNAPGRDAAESGIDSGDFRETSKRGKQATG